MLLDLICNLNDVRCGDGCDFGDSIMEYLDNFCGDLTGSGDGSLAGASRGVSDGGSLFDAAR